MGLGLIGFIKSVYFWDFYKALSLMYYTPRRLYPFKDMCDPFPD